MKKIQLGILLTLLNITVFANSEDSIVLKKTPAVSVKGYHFIYFNPIRSYWDELSLFYEFQISEKFATAIAMGYKRPMRIMGGLNEPGYSMYKKQSPDKAIRYYSEGFVIRSVFKYQKRIKDNRIAYVSFHAQYRYLTGNQLEIETNYDYESYYPQDCDITKLSRAEHIFGFQIQMGTRYLLKYMFFQPLFKPPVFNEFYLGIGFNISKYHTQYFSFKPTDDYIRYDNIPTLGQDDKNNFKPTFHIGYRTGLYHAAKSHQN